MPHIITLTIAGTDTGPFDLYSNVDWYVIPFATNISLEDMLVGYYTTAVPATATTIRIVSEGICPTFLDLTRAITTTTTTAGPTTTTTTLIPTTTTTTTGVPVTTTTTTAAPITTTTTTVAPITTTTTTAAPVTTTTTTTVNITTTTTTAVPTTTTTTTGPITTTTTTTFANFVTERTFASGGGICGAYSYPRTLLNSNASAFAAGFFQPDEVSTNIEYVKVNSMTYPAGLTALHNSVTINNGDILNVTIGGEFENGDLYLKRDVEGTDDLTAIMTLQIKLRNNTTLSPEAILNMKWVGCELTTTTTTTLVPTTTTTTTAAPTTTTTTTALVKAISLSDYSTTYDPEIPGVVCSGDVEQFTVTTNAPWWISVTNGTGTVDTMSGSAGNTTVTITGSGAVGIDTIFNFYWDSGFTDDSGTDFHLYRLDTGEECSA